MRKWLDLHFPITRRQQRTEEVREATHEAINELQSAIVRYQHQSKRDKEQIIDILSKSESELHSVAQKVARATSAHKRGLKH